MSGRQQRKHLRASGRTASSCNAPPDRALAAAAAAAGPVQVQNVLMKTGDRDLALAMMYLEEHERAELLGRVSSRKAARVRAELQLQERLRIEYRHYLDAVHRLTAELGGERCPRSSAGYLRPHRPRPRR